MLHTISASPRDATLEDCLRCARPDDLILLLGDGTYSAIAGSAAQQLLERHGAQVYVLLDDAVARGLEKNLWPGASCIDIEGFVSLTEQATTQQAWF